MSKLNLKDLIVAYVQNKSELDDYKKICDRQNAEIKEQMKESNLTEFEADGYVAKYSVTKRESMNEDKLLDILKELPTANNLNLIKTKEYVDMDALESAIYNEQIPQDVMLKLSLCRESKEVVTLRVSKAKKKED